MKCTSCDKEAAVLIGVFLNGQAQSLCDACLIKLQPEIGGITEIDEQIAKTQEHIREVEEMARTMIEPDLTGFPEGLAALAFTPSKMLLLAKTILTDLLRQKEDALNAMSEKERLTYKLKEALRVEDYTLAAELRDRLGKEAPGSGY